MAINERKHHIKILEKIFYGMEKLESGVLLPTSEVKTALAYAISSLKTDLKYDLMYEKEEIFTKDDVLAMLTELKSEIAIMSDTVVEDKTVTITSWRGMQKRICKLIQSKIDKLKENKE